MKLYDSVTRLMRTYNDTALALELRYQIATKEDPQMRELQGSIRSLGNEMRRVHVNWRASVGTFESEAMKWGTANIEVLKWDSEAFLGVVDSHPLFGSEHEKSTWRCQADQCAESLLSTWKTVASCRADLQALFRSDTCTSEYRQLAWDRSALLRRAKDEICALRISNG
uniref:Uncharacterized protein n=1 Tax=Kwoniella bestiolae CBS 10118 TaxID=1296100 RepID=A0A1B9G1R8_9TREE|nr:hypothetical protein I302_04774 [Kwoniella bestiolae CBS 10118]OCF24964.1 hypothetical protein I302_04774 [Kwoniella bestiolae CBS 10118]